MCSSPKSSTKYRHHSRKKEFSLTEYEEYARMVKRASACYEAAQQRKKIQQRETRIQPGLIVNPRKTDIEIDTPKSSLLSDIKTFLLKPVF